LPVSSPNWQQHYRDQIRTINTKDFGQLKLSIAIPDHWNRQTWFYFHGAGGNVHSWRNFVDNLYQYHDGSGYPNIVGISLGPKWFLTKQIESSKYDGSSLFWDTVIPKAASVVKDLGDTVAIGHSMGGFNALSLFLDRPDQWKKIVLMTPAIADLSPYANEKEIIEYLKKTGVYGWKMMFKTHILRQPIRDHGIETILNNWRGIAKDEREWGIINPFKRTEELERSGAARIFLSCGLNDPFGFAHGTTKVDGLLKRAGYSTELHIVKGGHMAIPYDKVYKWLFTR